MNDLVPGTKIEGSVRIANEDVYGTSTDVNKLRKKVGMVFQKPTPFPKSIFENVAYGMRVDGENSRSVIEAKVEDSLKKAALWDEVKDNLKKSALALSGGQQQRLCIARTLAIDSEIILMDEPTSALDPISTARVEELVKELVKSVTIVIVTHNMQQANRISGKTAFFYLGELVEFGATEQIFNAPAVARTKNYVNGIFG